MKTKKIAVEFIALFLVLMTVAFVVPTNAVAIDQNSEVQPGDEVHHTLVMKSDHLNVVRRKTIHMTAEVTNVEVQPVIVWSSSDESIATVDQEGNVTGVKLGKSVIRAQATIGDETLTGEFTINVVRSGNFLRDLLEEKQVLSYQYNFEGDYYYTNDKDAWQYHFGFGKIYDFVSPYILLEYDYIRIFFTYENKDWMLQFWKGQYGLVFYGGEVGIYNRPHSDEGIGAWTMFKCPEESDWIKMEITLWHQDLLGKWNKEFSRPYDYYWWCTGFKNGHLRQEEPADELRLTGRLTFKDEVMTELVKDGLEECGFEVSKTQKGMTADSIYVKDNDVFFSWQNINEAESTMQIKVNAGIAGSLLALPFASFIFPWIGGYAVLVLIASLIL